MTPLADLVRETLAEHSEAAPQGSALLESVRHGIKWSRRRRALGISSTTLALVGVVAAAAFLASPDPQTPPQIALGGHAAPPGMQAVSYRGVELFVPADWQLDATRCGTPVKNTVTAVMPGAAVPLCLIPQPAGLTVVRLGQASGLMAKEATALADRPVDLDGHEAMRGAGALPDFKGTVAVLVVPSQDVVVTVESRNQALADRILNSARVVAADWAGCETRRPGPVTFRFNDEDGDLVPRQPDGGSVCRYADGWLMRSATLTPDEAVSLAGELNALAPKTAVNMRNCLNPLAQTTYVVRFDIGDDHPLDVEVRNACYDMFASSGTMTRQADLHLMQHLTEFTGNDSFALG
jgi:hypothetical protein